MNKVDVLLDMLRWQTFVVFLLISLVMRGQGIKLTSYIAKNVEKKTLNACIEKKL